MQNVKNKLPTEKQVDDLHFLHFFQIKSISFTPSTVVNHPLLPQCLFCSRSQRSSLIAYFILSSHCLINNFHKDSLGTYWSKEAGRQSLLFFPSKSSPPVSAQVCCRPSALASLHSLSSFSWVYADPGGIPCFPPSCSPPQLPTSLYSIPVHNDINY